MEISGTERVGKKTGRVIVWTVRWTWKRGHLEQGRQGVEVGTKLGVHMRAFTGLWERGLLGRLEGKADISVGDGDCPDKIRLD